MAVRLLVFLVMSLSIVNAGAFRDLYNEAMNSNKVKVSRAPAAIPSQVQIQKQNLKEALIEINCGRKLAQEMRVNSPWAQIKGRYCKPSKSKLVEIKNESNGFTASVFDMGENHYKTDLIQLSAGSNEIRIRSHLPDGSTEEQTVTIDRSPI
jgi:hypothetical protein